MTPVMTRPCWGCRSQLKICALGKTATDLRIIVSTRWTSLIRIGRWQTKQSWESRLATSWVDSTPFPGSRQFRWVTLTKSLCSRATAFDSPTIPILQWWLRPAPSTTICPRERQLAETSPLWQGGLDVQCYRKRSEKLPARGVLPGEEVRQHCSPKPGLGNWRLLHFILRCGWVWNWNRSAG